MATLVIATTADAPRDLLTFIGQTNGEDVLRFKGETVKLTELAELNEATLATIYPHYGEQGSLRPAAYEADLSELLEEKVAAQPAFEVKTFNLGGKKPKVLIPTFPGTNCELDTARAFELAGAEPEIFLFRNLDQDVLNVAQRTGGSWTRPRSSRSPAVFPPRTSPTAPRNSSARHSSTMPCVPRLTSTSPTRTWCSASATGSRP